MERSRIIIIGAGVGGLTAGALLQQAGYQVTVLEAQTYPGGCASTYTHKGFRFESGATVVGGFQPDGPHAIVGEKLGIEWPVRPHDPAWVTHLPDRHVALTADNADVLEKFPHTRAFWEQQSKLASIAWSLSAQGLPWPPRSSAEFAQLLKVGLLNFPRDLQVIPFALSSVKQWLRWHGLHDDAAFVRFLDAQLLISAQTTTAHVNALYGATALDLARQGVYHVAGGIGGVSEALADKLTELGGEIAYRQQVTRISARDGRVDGVYTTKGKRGQRETFHAADFVIANTTPWNLDALLGDDSSRGLRGEARRRKAGWGAFVLHLGVNDAIFPPDFPDHHQIITDMTGALGETRSLFLSLSPRWDDTRAPSGQRAMTITTHTNVSAWWRLLESDPDAYNAHKEEYASRIIAQVNQLVPGFKDNLTLILPGTPVTYNFYTGRHLGMVGGFPQTSLFKARSPRTGIPNLRLVGDSIFPGQSTAGVTLGAMRVAEDVRHNLPIASHRRTPADQPQRQLEMAP